MNKNALAIVIPVVIVGAAVAGAWYTGTQIEQQINSSISQANQVFKERLPEADVHVSLLELQRGFFSSTARYSVSFDASGASADNTLLFSDHIEHGPFPASRLSAGKLMPVLAQSHITLENNALVAPLFTAAGGQTPLSVDISLHYDQAADGLLKTSSLDFMEGHNAFKISPSTLNFSLSDNQKHLSALGKLAQVDLNFVERNGLPASAALRDLEIEFDKQESATGFALGPSLISLKSLSFSSHSAPTLVLTDAWLQESLTQGSKGLDQNVIYRVGNLQIEGQEIGSLSLDLSANNLDEAALKRFDDAFEKIAEDDLSSAELSTEQQADVHALTLALLESKPQLAINELSLKTNHGLAKATLNVDLHKPENTSTLEQTLSSSVASLNAEIKVDKSVIGDLAALQLLAEEGPDDLNPEQLQQQAAMLTELLSGMALGSQWAVLEGNTLSSSLSYNNNRVTFNGKDMSVPEFLAFAMGHAHNLGVPALGDDALLQNPQD